MNKITKDNLDKVAGGKVKEQDITRLICSSCGHTETTTKDLVACKMDCPRCKGKGTYEGWPIDAL